MSSDSARYDIPTLMAMSHNAHIESTRFSDQARGNNLLRQNNRSQTVLSEQPGNQPRVASNTSTQTEVASSVGSRSGRPIRQPTRPPRGRFAQADAGFVQFLKKHSSPRHQRVTAGGRIVPMDGQNDTRDGLDEDSRGASPSYERKETSESVQLDQVEQPERPKRSKARLGSFHRSKRGRKKKSSDNKTEESSSINNTSQASLSATNAPAPPGGPTALAGEALTQQLQDLGFYPNASFTPVTPGVWPLNDLLSLAHQNPILFNPQYQQPLIPYIPGYTGYLLDTEKSFLYPSAVNTQGPMLSSYSGLPVQAVSPYLPGYEQPTAMPQTYWQQFLSNQAVPQAQTTVVPSSIEAVTQQGSPEQAGKAYMAISQELARIDRYIAVHTWDITPQEKSTLVEQRKRLVRELDTVRMYKEQLDLITGSSSPFRSHGPQDSVATGSAPSDTYRSSGMANGQHGYQSQSSVYDSVHAGSSLTRPSLANQFPLLFQPKDQRNSDTLRKGISDLHTFDQIAGSGVSGTGHQSLKISKPSNSEAVKESSLKSAEPSRSGSRNVLVNSTNLLETELHQLHQKIRDATRDGGTVDDLLKRLSKVTAELLKQRTQEKKMPEQPASNKSTIVRRINTQSESALEPSTDIQGFSSLRPSRRLWHSDIPNPRTTRSRLSTSHETDDKSLAYVSTTDSWASIASSERLLFERRLKDEINGKSGQSSLRGPGRIPTCSSSSAEREASGLRHSSDWLRSSGSEQGLHKSNNITPPYELGLDGASSMEGPKGNRLPLLNQCLSQDRSPILQKTAASTAPQNVNASAILPRFNIAADTSNSSATDDKAHGKGKKASPAKGNRRPWYMMPAGPNPALARLFYWKTKDNQAEALQSYAATQGWNPWWST